ncbi:MAG: Holliday junction resolvase RuvX [Akkermansia sp.]
MTSPHPALGIDYGEARIGIAATDPVGIMAHPVETIHRHQTDGFPALSSSSRNGNPHPGAGPSRPHGRHGRDRRSQGACIRQGTGRSPSRPSLIFMDECLTTVIAQEKLHAAGKKAKTSAPSSTR